MSVYKIAELAAGKIDRRIKSERYRNDPVLWAEEYLGVQLWSKQKEILYSIRDNRGTAVAAGHGVGKSYVAAVAACWWMAVHPSDEVYLATTAPSVAQTNILWNNIKSFFGLAQRRYEAGLVTSPLPGYVTSDNKWKLTDGRIIGEGRKPAERDSDYALQGTHATYLLAIGDEAVGLSEKMLQALDNIATGVRNRRLLIANPTDPSSAMAAIWNKQLSQWTTMHISVFDSPLITKEKGFDHTKADALSGWDYIEGMREAWGEDHPFYISRVLGQWAFDVGNGVFTELDIASAMNTCVMPDPEAEVWLGCDIAWSDKGDFSSAYAARPGVVWEVDPDTGAMVKPTDRRGWQVRRVGAWQGAPLAGGSDENPSNGMLIDSHALAVAASRVKIDSSGVGMAVIQDLASQPRRYDVYKMAGGNPAREKNTYTNARAEAFFDIKLLAHQGLLDLDPDDEEMIDQLRSIQYEYDSRNRIKIESKADMRARGRKSPDFADAVWYALYDPEFGAAGPQKRSVITYDSESFTPDWFNDLRGMPV